MSLEAKANSSCSSKALYRKIDGETKKLLAPSNKRDNTHITH